VKDRVDDPVDATDVDEADHGASPAADLYKATLDDIGGHRGLDFMGIRYRRTARGFLSHNAGFRRDTLLEPALSRRIRPDCAGSILYSRLDGGVQIVLNPRQLIAHAFSMRWWIGKLHARFGYEVYRVRRMGSPVVDSRVSRLGLLEPALTMAWHVLLDVPQWFRYGRVLEWSLPARLCAVPVLLALSRRQHAAAR